MRLNDDEAEADRIANKIDEAAQFHSDQILKKDHADVSMFINVTSNKLLELVEDIEDDSLAIAMTQMLGAVLGGLGKACLELKAENLMLKHDILEELQGNQDPELN
jgi:hypothetical protein